VIDAHQHFWRIGHNDCTWPTPDLAVIHRDFGPEDLKALARPLGIESCVLVQSQESRRDTAWLLDVAAGDDFVKAVVGWTDLKAHDAADGIAALAARPKLAGLRPMLQSLPDDWIADPALDPAIAAMTAHRLSFDALVFPRHLPRLADFAERHPDLAIVIDHGAKPPIASGAWQPWADDVARIARLPNVFCKLSGLLTEADGRRDALKPHIGHLLTAFGPNRLMWGSDWPVLELAGDYAGWLSLVRGICGDDAALFGGTARRFYGFGDA
jgi:L-fuconolactonase